MKENKINKNKKLLSAAILLICGIYAYSAVSFRYEFIRWDNAFNIALYTLLIGICAALATALAFAAGKSEKSKSSKLIFFNVLLSYVLLWIPALIALKLGVEREEAGLLAVILTTFMFAVSPLCFIVNVLGKNLRKRVAYTFMSAVLIISCIISSIYISKFGSGLDTLQLEKESTMNLNFSSINASGLSVSKEEKNSCISWYSDNIINAGTDGKTPAYDFSVDGVSLRDTLSDWTFSAGKASETGAYYKGGKTTEIALTNDKLGLSATVIATIYEDYATCEWTVYIENTSDKNSGVISDFYSADCDFTVGEDAELYYSTGSDCSADDFTLKKAPLSELSTVRLGGYGGRSSVDYMPYFNITGKTGLVVSVGWTGQWEAICKPDADSLNIKAHQESLEAYLLPGEEIRSPLVSICFYDGQNALKGFNTLRRWQSSLAPDVSSQQVFYCYANEQNYITTSDNIEEMLKLGDFSALWVDAAWYNLSHGNWYNSVGSWSAESANKELYPNGISSVADFAHSKNLKFLLWYEPERVTKGSELFTVAQENKQWLLEGSEYLWNLADPTAYKYLCAYINTSIKDIGVDIYRQDFNTEALKYWQWGDKEFYDGRTGITENHYITNLYAFWDYLLQTNSGLLIDNCASGGRRLDIETARRSVALHRSDYIGENEANQSITYGISMWVPDNGIILKLDNEYTARSWMTALNNVSTFNADNADIYKDFYNLHKSTYGSWFKNYFPLTPQNHDTDKWLAMQFGDGAQGFASVYKRENVSGNSYLLMLQGLSEDTKYIVTDYDNPDKPLGTYTGNELMTEGIMLEVEEAPKAMIITYKAK